MILSVEGGGRSASDRAELDCAKLNSGCGNRVSALRLRMLRLATAGCVRLSAISVVELRNVEGRMNRGSGPQQGPMSLG